MIEWILVANDTLGRWELKYSMNLKRFLYKYIIYSVDWVVGTRWNRQAYWQSETWELLCLALDELADLAGAAQCTSFLDFVF